jgi:hypothetical protein
MCPRHKKKFDFETIKICVHENFACIISFQVDLITRGWCLMCFHHEE